MNQAISKAIIFDMDGTIFETNDVALQAFQKTFELLVEKGHYDGEIPSNERFLDQLGKTFDDIWADLLPYANEEIRILVDQWMLDIELNLIRDGVGKLYPDVKEVLERLVEMGYSLFVASNGHERYISAIVDHYKINHLFVDLYSAGRFQTKSKVDLVQLLRQTYHVQAGYMVGDRRSDVEAGKANGFTVVGCQFGFADVSELQDADIRVSTFFEMLEYVKRSEAKA